MAGETEEKVKAMEATKPVEKNAEIAEPTKAAPAGSEMQPVLVFGLCFLAAVVLAVVQQSNILDGGSLTSWSRSLFEEHFVPPPIAHDSICTIQFCQS